MLNETVLLEDLLYLDLKIVIWYLAQQDIWLAMNSEFLKMEPIIQKEFTQVFTDFPEEFHPFNLHSFLNTLWTSWELAVMMSNLYLSTFLSG